jgi:manganese oxidase
MLRDFDYGTVTQENGQTVREFRVEAQTSTIKLDSAHSFITWNLNGRVPGPTFRATEGDKIRVIFYNRAGHSHSLHFHGVHRSEVDGVKPIRNGSVMIYEFDAEPYGVHLYHCHVAPVTRHVGKGLYGMFIIDPPQPRPPADEMMLIMAGYDVNNDKKNELYAFNGLPHYYMHHPIAIGQNQLIRLYVLNMIEFDAAVTFHLHANMFKVNRTGRSLQPSEETDVITMGTAERHILEFSYRYPGKYMFHPHQDAIAEAGCMGLFEVMDSTNT